MQKVVGALKNMAQTARYYSYYPRFKKIGDGVIFDNDIWINRPHNISIGECTFIGMRCRLNAIERISIGRYCGIAAGCTLMTWNHRIHDRTIELRATGKEAAPIEVGDGAWMGYDATILPGVTIGKGAVVGASAVVNKDIDPFEIVGGVPAKPIGRRTDDGVSMYD
ncbi:acyltransferase [Salinibacter ruber]|uniref:acyltransferase n=1 Tax=Salinibacter ruber TaxID=146919 RepID=UPI00207403EC|nr:acyltransferase [Salinibacter ruber]MCS4181774.1 acetyltransferase-like isoleucine patch superfamily enzyme [Salinibacter ruber]